MFVETIATAIVAGFILSIDPERKLDKYELVLFDSIDEVNQHLRVLIACDGEEIIETTAIKIQYQLPNGRIEEDDCTPYQRHKIGDHAVKIRCQHGHETWSKVVAGLELECSECATSRALIDDSVRQFHELEAQVGILIQ